MNLDLEGYSFKGRSRGSEKNTLMVKPSNILIDIGVCPDSALRYSKLFITHGHIDHAGEIAYYVSQRKLMRMGKTTIYLPKEILQPINSILSLWEEIEDIQFDYQLIPVDPQKEYKLDAKRTIKGYSVDHRIPALGYAIFEHSTKLKSEYLSLPGREIQQLREDGADIFYYHRSPTLFFSGDATLSSIMEIEAAAKAKILFLECTFVDEVRTIEKTISWGHIHLDQIMDNPQYFSENKYLVLYHFSRRYQKEYIEKKVWEKCPEALKNKLILFH